MSESIELRHPNDFTTRPAPALRSPAVAGRRAGKASPVGIGDLEPHRRELTGYCHRMVGPSEADDAVQETMLRAWRASAGFDGRSSVRA
jgi:DNA-directed RNA polymerase specialized sigma24 family protein